MNFSESTIVSVPISNPVEKYGKGYRVVSVFLTNSTEDVTHKNVPDSSLERAFFEQEFNSSSLNFKWHVAGPEGENVYKEETKIINNKYISGFNITLYKNNRDLIGESVAVDRAFIRKYTGIEGNVFNYPIEDFTIRSYSADIDLYDYFGNTHTATFITKNPEPSAEILNYENVGGTLDISYSGSEDLQYLKVSNYSGLVDSSYHESYTGSNGLVSVPLIPNRPNYLKIEPYDGFGYSPPISMSGYSFEEKKSFPFKLKVKSVKLNKKDGGRSVEFDMQANFENNPYVSAKYQVLTSGAITGAELGYDNYIYLDSGEFNNTELNVKNTGFNYTIDNQFTWQNSINTGVLTSGDNDPVYSYWDYNNDEVKSISLYDIRSGQMPVRGIFSMPIDEPNSYDIKFRNGINFRGEYEKASSYLATIGEMPAVIINESQANKLKSYTGAVGWVGLRRGNVGVFDGLFSENSINQNIFKSVDFENQYDKTFNYLNKQEEEEDINYISRDIGDDWAWVNSSGTHIYKYVKDEQYNPETYFKFKIDAESTISNDKTSMERNLFVLPVDLSNISGSISQETLSVDYKMKEGDSIESIDLHTGDNLDFIISEENLVQQYDYEEGSTIQYTAEKNNPARYIKANFEDFLGNTEVVDINQIYYESQGQNQVEELRFTTNLQNTTLPLDDLVGGSLKLKEVDFLMNHSSIPRVEFSVGYSGDPSLDVEFINAMIFGQPTESNVNFILDKVPPVNGYFINIKSDSD